MSAVLRLLAAGILALLCHPLMAHDGEHHGEAKPASAGDPVSAAPSNSGRGDARVGTSQTQRPIMQHETNRQSVWVHLHPASVHFPIALLLGAALIEALSMARGSASLFNAAGVMTWLGASGAVIAALLGWVHTGLWLGGDATMQWHRWTGTSLAIVAPAAALLSRRADRRIFRFFLFAIAVMLCDQGYWGGELAHGPNHLGL